MKFSVKFRKYVCGGIRSMKKITFFTFLHVYFLPWRDIIPELIMWVFQSFVLCSTTTNLITSLGTQCCWYEKKLEKSDPKQTTVFLKSRLKTDQFSQKNRSEKIFLYHILSVNFAQRNFRVDKFLHGFIFANWIFHILRGFIFAILYFPTISWSNFSIQLLHFNRFWQQKSEKQTWSSKRRPKTDQNSQNVCLTD